jgi:hypothetical protein
MKPKARKQTRIMPLALPFLLALAHAAAAVDDDKVEQQLIDAPAGAGVRI